jgi:CheY-like chemotaxis protein
LLFEVEDTGIGIAPEELETIFDPFEQSQKVHQTADGTGLGLALTRSFVRLMGGEIHVTSEVGKGSCFSFEIPVELADAAAIQATRPLRQVIGLAPNQTEYRILVVDDDPDSRLFLMQLLGSVGFGIREAGNGQEAVAQFQDWQPQAILMDIRMPVMDGYEAVGKIRNEELRIKNKKDCKIIALTSSVFERDKMKILGVGCDDVLRKPVKEADIFEELQKYLGVQYVYKEPEQGRKVAESQEQAPKENLTPEALAALPADLLSALEQALIKGNRPMIEQAIESIRSCNAAVADMVAVMAQDFKYQAIWAIIQDIRRKGNGVME